MATKAARRHTQVMDGALNERRSTSPAHSGSQFTIGKLDAGIAVLLGDESSHLIEFPSLLLPPGCQPGSIVSISCTRDTSAEKQRSDDFWSLQDDIMQEFGHRLPVAPSLRQRNVTQTSVALEWDRLETATSKLLGLTIWRNGQRVASIPNPANNTSTKLSGLELDTEYTFHLVLKTTAGTFPSNQLKLRTHKMTNTSGISACFGAVSPPQALDDAKRALEAMGAKWSDKIQIDTTHFICTSPGTGPPAIQYQRALQLSIPTVLPSWIQACQRDKRMVQIAAHYLGTAQPPSASTSAAPPTVSINRASDPVSPPMQRTVSPPAEPAQPQEPEAEPSSPDTARPAPVPVETTASPLATEAKEAGEEEAETAAPEEQVETITSPSLAEASDNVEPLPPTTEENGRTSPTEELAIAPPATEEIEEPQGSPYEGIDEDEEPIEGTKTDEEETRRESEEARAAPAAEKKVDIEALEDVAL